MKTFATICQLLFQPGLSAPKDAAAVANDVYTTPSALRERLHDLARLSYALATFKGVLHLSAASATGEATVRLTDGTTDYATAVVDLTAGTELPFSVEEVDLSNVNGGTALYVAVDIGTGADGAQTFQVAAALNVRHPLTVFGGC